MPGLSPSAVAVCLRLCQHHRRHPPRLGTELPAPQVGTPSAPSPPPHLRPLLQPLHTGLRCPPPSPPHPTHIHATPHPSLLLTPVHSKYHKKLHTTLHTLRLKYTPLSFLVSAQVNPPCISSDTSIHSSSPDHNNSMSCLLSEY